MVALFAVALVKPGPYEYDRHPPDKYTLVYHDASGCINFFHCSMEHPNDSEKWLNLYEESVNPDCIPSLGIYEYDLIGIVRGHIHWVNYEGVTDAK